MKRPFTGGALHGYFSTNPTLVNCTITWNNAGTDGGAIYHEDGSARSVIVNSILWGDTARGDNQEIRTDPVRPVASYVTFSIVEGGFEGEGNLDAEPLLDTELRPLVGPPAIDGGGCGDQVLSTDLAGEHRWDIGGILNGTGFGVDIRAYEFWGSPAVDDLVLLFSCNEA